MMDSGAALRDEPRDWRILRRGLEQLDRVVTAAEFRDAHLFVFQRLVPREVEPQDSLVNGNRLREVADGDSNVVQFLNHGVPRYARYQGPSFHFSLQV